MERHVVIGTAGHIDHGKTTLVRALTGVDTDRLAEEKSRGITIDLGFAPLELDGVHASVVDVPGHEGFIRNMVAGATGVDAALLVVAADEGVMPQTREHVAILRHLGVTRGVVALTKTDLAPDAAWRELVADDVRSLLLEQVGVSWPVAEVSAQSGQGLDQLRAALSDVAQSVPERTGHDRFRMPVDRVFALAGAGTIVTGTVWSGVVHEGDTVLVLPAGVEARVRTIQVHGHAAPQTAPGRRSALALVGLSREHAARGAVVVSGAGWRTSRAIEAALILADGVVLKARQRLRLHHGTAEVMARVAKLGAANDGVVPVRLLLDEPLVARAGDHLVLRSWSPVTTIGGGTVTDPWAGRVPGGRRRTIPAAVEPDDSARLAALVARQGPAGLTMVELEVALGVSAERLAKALEDAPRLGIATRDGWLVAAREVDAAAERMTTALDAFHAAQPLEAGLSAQAWRAASKVHQAALIELAEQRLLDAGTVMREGALVRRPDFNAGASRQAQESGQRLLDLLRQADAEPPSVAELASSLPGTNVGAVLRLLVRSGAVVAVADRYYEAGALGRELDRLKEALAAQGPSTPAQVRERLGRSRKWLIPLLEWADREGVTVRDGDRRTLRVEMGA